MYAYFCASACLTRMADELKGQLLEMGICQVLIPLTASPSNEVQGNSAAALGNLASRGTSCFVDCFNSPSFAFHRRPYDL